MELREVGLSDHPREVIQAALAHAVQHRVESAYARSDLFERRRWQIVGVRDSGGLAQPRAGPSLAASRSASPSISRISATKSIMS